MADPRSNYSAAGLLATIPDDIRDIPEVTEWFTDIYRWADIERIEDIKADAWVAIQQNDDLTSRQHHVDVLTAKLESFIKIYSIETPTPTPEPDPGIKVDPGTDPGVLNETLSTTDHDYDYPATSSVAGEPDLDDMPKLPTATPL